MDGSIRVACEMTVFPHPKAPGTAAVPPRVTGKRASMTSVDVESDEISVAFPRSLTLACKARASRHRTLSKRDMWQLFRPSHSLASKQGFLTLELPEVQDHTHDGALTSVGMNWVEQSVHSSGSYKDTDCQLPTVCYKHGFAYLVESPERRSERFIPKEGEL